MAISHVCLSCGLDLARVRARLDPHYALPIVVCPDCGRAAVRRKHRIGRRTLKLLASLVALIVQAGLAAAGVFGLTVVSHELGGMLARGGLGALPREEIILRLAACAAFAVALGAWLTAGLGHCRRLRTWLVFLGAGAVMVSLVPLFDALPEWLPERYAMLALVMAVATAGIPVGMLARTAGRGIERVVWRSRRRRLRARSIGR